MADIIQDVRVRVGFMGARWLLGGKRRAGKVTSSVVYFFEELVPVKAAGAW